MVPVRRLGGWCGLAAAVGVIAILGGAGLANDAAAPRYDGAGRLVPPEDYRSWVFLSSGFDMSYSRAPAMQDGHMFDNVFVNPAAYAVFRQTGHWPDGTMLVLENRGGASHGSIVKLGQFQTGEIMGLEAHVRDSARFKDGWGFFAFDGGKPATEIAHGASCYACHTAHAAVDTTFVQFYPTLLPVATRLKTLSEAYIRESADGAGK